MKLLGFRIKEFLFLTVGALIICFTSSCNKEKESFNPLLGSWDYIYETYTDCNNPVDDGTYDFVCTDLDCFKIVFGNGDKLTYKALVSGSETATEGTYRIEDGLLTLCVVGCDDPVAFEITGNNLSLIREDNAGCTVSLVLQKSM